MNPPVAAIILAAGKGTRMESDLPKVLHSMAGQTMLAHVLHATNGLSPQHTVVVTGVGAQQVEAEARYTTPAAICVRQTEQLGTGHAVMQTENALQNFTGIIAIAYGDAPLLGTAALQSVIASLKTENAQVAVLSTRVENPTGFGRIVRTPSGAFQTSVEERNCTPEQRLINEVNTCIYAIESKVLYNLLKQVKPTPPKGEYYLTDILHLALQNNLKVSVVLHPGGHDLLGCNTPAELAAATTRFHHLKTQQGAA